MIKRRDGIWSKIKDAVLGKPLPTEGQVLRQSGNGAYNYSDLPQTADNIELSGTRYVDGLACHTVGELKDAYAKKYPLGGRGR